MHKLTSNQPIGIFDSGIGGLTVASALAKKLPLEKIIYFGDTAHLPYGDKSPAAIQAYSVKIAHMLLQQKCKLILIACNSASSAAYDLVREYVGNQAIVLDVIQPTVNYLREHYVGKTIGLIGTKQTVNSNIYKKKLDELNKNITLCSQATSLLAPAIEEGSPHSIIKALLEHYLNQPILEGISALVLGCTHYPVIKVAIDEYYQHKMVLIDSSEIVANAVAAQLEFNNLLNNAGTGDKTFYISDYTDSFAAGARLFFEGKMNLQHYPLWD